MSGTETDRCIVVRSDLDALFPALRRQGYETLGPVVQDGAVVYDTVESLNDLPGGWTDEQSPGSYRVTQNGGSAIFAWAVGPHSWKSWLHEPAVRLFQIERGNGDGWRITGAEPRPCKLAFIGMRACELHALSIRDRVFLKGRISDPAYRERRANVFIVAVHCGRPSANCFCTSMKTGPRCPDGYDIALTEIVDGEHRFLAEAGTDAGRKVIAQLPRRAATEADSAAADAVVDAAAKSIHRSLDTRGLKQTLYAAIEHPRYENAGKRCMACGNCTMVCPTCFCSTVEDSSDLTGKTAERWRYQDSCFSQQFSYIHGGSVRSSVAARYRHWLTHKFASWWDQFGTSGCVGCGRCITWCPAGIDITEEIHAIRESTRGVPA